MKTYAELYSYAADDIEAVDKKPCDNILDQMAVFMMPDLRAKALAYGAFGHQTMFDENQPFKISRHANQPSTNLVNFNNTIRNKVFK